MTADVISNIKEGGVYIPSSRLREPKDTLFSSARGGERKTVIPSGLLLESHSM